MHQGQPFGVPVRACTQTCVVAAHPIWPHTLSHTVPMNGNRNDSSDHNEDTGSNVHLCHRPTSVWHNACFACDSLPAVKAADGRFSPSLQAAIGNGITKHLLFHLMLMESIRVMFVSTTRTGLRLVRRLGLFTSFGVAALLVAGCGGGDTDTSSSSSSKPSKKTTAKADKKEEAPAKEETPADTAAAETPAKSEEPVAAKPAPKKPVDPNATGNFVGTVVLEGDAPKLAALVEKGAEDVKDKEVCGAQTIPDDSVLVGDGNGLANVFIYLRRAPKGYDAEVPSEAVVLDQKGCVFTPHVALIQAGQKVLVKSSDPIQHNIHTFPQRNQGTNLLIKPNDQEGVELAYPKAETEPVQVKCDIHAWMSSYHLVLDHPFMALTDENGKFSVEGLPAGDYEFRVWHEKGGLLEKGYEVTITGEDEPVTLKYAAEKFQG